MRVLLSVLGLTLPLASQIAPAPIATIAPDDVVLELVQSPQAQAILSGATTNVWAYRGRVVAGAADALTPVPNSYLGPTIRVWQGQHVTIRLENRIGEPSVAHWHGLDVPAAMDGHPALAFAHGGSFTYSFPIVNRAGTYWYHPHPDMRTGVQANMGLAGFFVVHDHAEASLGLPDGAQDVALCLQDRTFDAANQFVYAPDMINGVFGSTILVNGRPGYVHSAATRAYRLRLLNGSTSRIYKLAFGDGTPLTVIGTDGGLLDVPRVFPYVMLAPGQRIELWADFRTRPVNTQIVLQSHAFAGAGAFQGTAFDVMRFSIDRAETETRVLPPALSSIPRYRLQDAVNANAPKVYAIGLRTGGGPPQFTLNGGTFDMVAVAPNEVARCNTLEVIQLTNLSGMMLVAHPIHFHGRQFQVWDRSITSGGLGGWTTVKDGYVDSGWLDTVMLMPGETVRILVRHGAYPGLYLYHCHNLAHEDMGMMRNFRLVR